MFFRSERGQGSAEMLSTYAIAVIIIAVAVGVLSLALSQPNSVVPSSCGFVSNLNCQDVIVLSSPSSHNTTIMLSLTNPLRYPIYGTTIFADINGRNSTETACSPAYIRPGGNFTCIFNVPEKTMPHQFMSGDLYANFSYCGLSASNPANSCNSPTLVNLGHFTATVSAQTQLLVSVYPPSTTVTCGQMVTLNAVPSGGTSPYSYQWSLEFPGESSYTEVPGAIASFYNYPSSCSSTGTVHCEVAVTDKNGDHATSPPCLIDVVTTTTTTSSTSTTSTSSTSSTSTSSTSTSSTSTSSTSTSSTSTSSTSTSSTSTSTSTSTSSTSSTSTYTTVTTTVCPSGQTCTLGTSSLMVSITMADSFPHPELGAGAATCVGATGGVGGGSGVGSGYDCGTSLSSQMYGTNYTPTTSDASSLISEAYDIYSHCVSPGTLATLNNIPLTVTETAAKTCSIDSYMPFILGNGIGTESQTYTIPPTRQAYFGTYVRERPTVEFENLVPPNSGGICGLSNTVNTTVPYDYYGPDGLLSVSTMHVYGTPSNSGPEPPNVSSLIGNPPSYPTPAYTWTYQNFEYTQTNGYFDFCGQAQEYFAFAYAGQGLASPVAYKFLGWVGSGTGSYTGPDPIPQLQYVRTNITESAQWGQEYGFGEYKQLVSYQMPSSAQEALNWMCNGTPEYSYYLVGYGYFPVGTTLTSTALPSYWSPSGYDYCYGPNNQYGYGEASEYTGATYSGPFSNSTGPPSWIYACGPGSVSTSPPITYYSTYYNVLELGYPLFFTMPTYSCYVSNSMVYIHPTTTTTVVQSA